MTSPSESVAPSVSPLFWRQLLALLDERRVVPIVGPEAMLVESSSGVEPVTTALARRVEALLELEATASPTLHAVACRWLATAGPQRIAEVYGAVRVALDEQPIAMPDTLRKLARIRAFDLFVTTTPDDLLRRAIDEERFGGKTVTKVFAYSPDSVQDLPAPLAQLGGPVVYHLLGRASTVPDFCVTDEDTLEFVHSLQSENRRPNRLLDELRSHSLLILGSGYSGWLARFFLRTARGERILLARSKTDVVADARAMSDEELTTFLRQFSAQTRVFGGADAFIDELFDRWQEHATSQADAASTNVGPSSGAAASGLAPAGGAPVASVATSSTASAPPHPVLSDADDEASEHAIFISYASEDRDAALALAAALSAAKLPVWFDRKGGLEGGDDYELKIRRSIEGASLFVPLLSPHVLTQQRRFFRLEWTVAGEVALRAAATLPFVVPVRIGRVPSSSPEIPEHIRRTQWMDGGDGSKFDAIVQRLRELYRQYVLSMRGTQ
jgi:hypothetical protein